MRERRNSTDRHEKYDRCDHFPEHQVSLQQHLHEVANLYLPIQNSRKTASRTSSLVTAPVIEASASAARPTSTATISGGIEESAARRADSSASSARARDRKSVV